MSDNPMKDYVENFRANLPSGVTYDSDIARYFANVKRFLNGWEVGRYIEYIQKFDDGGVLLTESGAFLINESEERISL